MQEARYEVKRQEQRSSLTLKKFLDEHYESYLIAMNPKPANQSFMCITNNFKHLANKPLAEITTWDIQQWHTSILTTWRLFCDSFA